MPTQDIVLNIRCEAKAAVRERIRQALRDLGDPRLLAIPPDEAGRRIGEIRSVNPKLARKFEKYFNSVIGYDFDFQVDEDNKNAADAGFKLPFLHGGSFSLDIGGHADRFRSGHREFSMVETFEDLDLLDCRHFEQPDERTMYQITGSIGMARIMNTFIDLAEQGGGKQVYRDTITFTTEIFGEANPSVALEPVVGAFRVVKASADFSARRKDVHKLIVAINFPAIDDRTPVSDGRIAAATLAESKVATTEKVVESLCIARAEDREDEAGTIRLIAPESFCKGESPFR